MIRIFLLSAASVALLTSAAPAKAPPFATNAKVAFLIDLNSGAVLLDKNGDQRMPPASMAKMMTTNVAFELIDKGELALTKKCPVRTETWQKWHGPQAGSTMFLGIGEQPTVEDLLHGIVTLSGNDATVVLAECIAGTEEAFVNIMNENAKRLGLTNSRFGNSNGWPDEGRTYVTARDLATLARAEIENYPGLYKKFYSQTQFTWGKTLGSGCQVFKSDKPAMADFLWTVDTSGSMSDDQERLGNTAINRLLWTPEGFTLVGWADTAHLEQQGALDENAA